MFAHMHIAQASKAETSFSRIPLQSVKQSGPVRSSMVHTHFFVMNDSSALNLLESSRVFGQAHLQRGNRNLQQSGFNLAYAVVESLYNDAMTIEVRQGNGP